MDVDADLDSDTDPNATATASSTPTPDPERRATLAVPVALVAVALAAALGAAIALGAPAHSSPPDRAVDPGVARFELSVTPATDRVVLVHAGGPTVDPARLRIRIAVDGEPVAHQPPVPFFAARGFHSGPVGPFNSATGGDWAAGELAALRLAGTNTGIESGDRVVVRIHRGDRRLAVLEVTAC
jgi:hypothetical protein